MKAKISLERRLAVRRRLNSEFALLEGAVSEYVIDVSRTGLRLRTSRALAMGSRVPLRFTLLLDELEWLEGEGEVVRIFEGTPRDVGIRFSNLTAESQRVIERALAVPDPALNPA